MSRARKHHYVSKFYLTGFTKSGGSKAKIHVIDKMQKKSFETTLHNIGAHRDFNRVEIEGNENAVEEALAGFEDTAARVFKRIITNERLPEGDDFIVLMNFVCLLAIRNPNLRESFGDAKKRVYERIMHLIVSSKEIYESQIKKMGESTGKNYSTTSYEDARKFVEERRYDIEIPTHSFVTTELSVFNNVLPYFFKRKWSMIRSSKKVGEFVTSDHPVTLITTVNTGNFGVGYGMKNTEVAFPISRFLAIVGVFEDILPPYIDATNRLIGDINGRTVNYSMNQVYSAHKSFYFMDLDGEIKQSNKLLH